MNSEREAGQERIPSKEEILGLISEYCETCTVTEELSDERGIYYLEAKGETKEPGEFTEYIYQRKGRFGKNQASATVLERIYYENDVACGGDIIAEVNPTTREWQRN